MAAPAWRLSPDVPGSRKPLHDGARSSCCAASWSRSAPLSNQPRSHCRWRRSCGSVLRRTRRMQYVARWAPAARFATRLPSPGTLSWSPTSPSPDRPLPFYHRIRLGRGCGRARVDAVIAGPQTRRPAHADDPTGSDLTAMWTAPRAAARALSTVRPSSRPVSPGEHPRCGCGPRRPCRSAAGRRPDNGWPPAGIPPVIRLV